MPRFFDDYSNTYLTHDSSAGRKQQRRGWKFRENFRLHYSPYVDKFRRSKLGLAAAQQHYIKVRGSTDPAIPPLPDGWVEELDDVTGITYYIDKINKTRTWVRPGFIPPPPGSSGNNNMPPRGGTFGGYPNRGGGIPPPHLQVQNQQYLPPPPTLQQQPPHIQPPPIMTGIPPIQPTVPIPIPLQQPIPSQQYYSTSTAAGISTTQLPVPPPTLLQPPPPTPILLPPPPPMINLPLPPPPPPPPS